MGVAARLGMIPAVLLGDLNMLRCFVGSGVETLVASSNPNDPTLRSRHAKNRVVIAPFGDTERVLSDLEAIGCGQATRPSLFYGTDQQLLTVSRHRERLEPLFRMRLPPKDLVERLVDKSRFAELATEFVLPVPATLSSHEISTMDPIVEKIPGPWLVKPNVHEGWSKLETLKASGPKKALRAETPAELRELLNEVRCHTKAFVVQAYVPGGEDQIYSFHAYMDASASVLGHFIGKKIRTFPREAGISTFLELVKEPTVAELGFQIVKKLGLVGPVKIDFKRDPRTGFFYVLELNARFNLWHHLGAVCGVNLALVAHADLAGQPPSPARDYRTGVRWLSFGDDLRSFLRSYRPSGEIGISSWLASLRGPKVHDVFAWTDPLPFCFGTLNYVKALGQRLLGAR
jgi:predicted ATP-grasp superfamily ATP-dependent carboligase